VCEIQIAPNGAQRHIWEGRNESPTKKDSPVSEPEEEEMSDWRLFSMMALRVGGSEEEKREGKATVVTEKERCVVSAVQEQ
jgi:hypothetical protein